VWVGNLTRNVTAEHVREIFAHYGEVQDVELPLDAQARSGVGHSAATLTANPTPRLACRAASPASLSPREPRLSARCYIWTAARWTATR